MKILLDTNAYTAMAKSHPATIERIRNAEKIYLSVIVIGELEYGFRYGSRYQINCERLERFCRNPFVEVLLATRITADRFGRIAAQLRTKGRPIPSNDIWIAAHAMESGSELLSFDKHFAQIDGLVWTMPAAGS